MCFFFSKCLEVRQEVLYFSILSYNQGKGQGGVRLYCKVQTAGPLALQTASGYRTSRHFVYFIYFILFIFLFIILYFFLHGQIQKRNIMSIIPLQSHGLDHYSKVRVTRSIVVQWIKTRPAIETKILQKKGNYPKIRVSKYVTVVYLWLSVVQSFDVIVVQVLRCIKACPGV